MPQEIFPPALRGSHNATILIVEDDADVGQFLQQLIEEDTPYHSSVIGNGVTALEQAPLVNPCLLLIDYRLPGMNGLELYDRLQQREDMRNVPAIMMSANLPVEEIRKRNIHQLRKPMDVGNVVRMITHAIASAEEQQVQEQYCS